MEDPDRPGDHACPHTLVTSIPDGIHKHKHTHNVNRWIEANPARYGVRANQGNRRSARPATTAGRAPHRLHAWVGQRLVSISCISVISVCWSAMIFSANMRASGFCPSANCCSDIPIAPSWWAIMASRNA